MTNDKFKPAFLALCAMFDKVPSKELITMYFEILDSQGMSDADFDHACKNVVLTHKYNTLPKPADLLASYKGDPEARALLAMQDLENAVRDVGPYESVTFIDPILGEIVERFENGWQGLCAMTTEELKWLYKDFVKLYKAKLSSGRYGAEPVKCIGSHEFSGRKVDPVLIGNAGNQKLIEEAK